MYGKILKYILNKTGLSFESKDLKKKKKRTESVECVRFPGHTSSFGQFGFILASNG